MGFFSSLFGKKQDNTPSDPFEKAAKLEKAGKYGEAIAFYKSHIEAHKGDVDAYKNLAELYGRLGKWKDGLEVAKLFDRRLSYLHNEWSHNFIQKAQSEISKTGSNTLQDNKTTGPVKVKTKSIPSSNNRDEKYNKVVKKEPTEVQKKSLLPTHANYSGMSNSAAYIDRLQAAIADLPPFDFYTGDDEPSIPADKAETIKSIFREQEVALLRAKEAETQKDYIKAASIYEDLYKRKALLPEVYESLIAIYRMSGLGSDADYIQHGAKSFFSDLRDKQKKAVLLGAEKYGCLQMVSKQIKEGKRISYYDGLYDLYNPFPFTEEW